MRRNTNEVFWSRVDKSGGENSCWPWLGRIRPDKYGVYDHDRTWDFAHRWVYYLTHGVHAVVCRHTCDNPPCCNPAHLINGTQLDNIRDRETRQRRKPPHGALNPAVKLTAMEVREMRDSYVFQSSTHGTVALGKKYNVSPGTVWRIVNKLSWITDN